MENEQKTMQLLEVTFDGVQNYAVKIPKGGSVNEVAFCIAVIGKCLLRDKVITSTDDFLKQIQKYMTDGQYDELEVKD